MNETKVSQQINDVVGDNVKKLAQLFPSAVKDGEVDFEALKEELGSFTEVGAEKYELTWAGKADAKRIAREDIIGRTLNYISDDGKDITKTENLYIEGENLEVLKLIRQNYYNSIQTIYIDPRTIKMLRQKGNERDNYMEKKEYMLQDWMLVQIKDIGLSAQMEVLSFHRMEKDLLTFVKGKK